jgi:transposase
VRWLRGGQPLATVTYQFENFYLYGAVEPTTGASFFLELPYLNTHAFQRWLDSFAAAFPESLNMLRLDNGAGHKAKAVHWPSNVVPVFLPPYSPELNPIERLWRDLKDQLPTSRHRLSMRCQMPCAPASNTTPPPPCNRC